MTVEICFTFAEILALSPEKALLIWYKIGTKDTFRRIEWGSLSAELVGEHACWFTLDEQDKLFGGMPHCKEAINSAIKRNPPDVLHAIYKSLWNTQTHGGAPQHVNIVEQIQEEGECACV